MIQPNMATMLAYIATDAKVSQTDLDTVLNDAVNQSFNRITVDGDTSTNDSCMLIATGQSVALTPEHNNWLDFKHAVNACLKELAQMIIRDAEGATKFITINVKQGVDATECLQVAFTVAHSPLVKTAFFASDAIWGRILMAVGRSGLQSLDINKVNLYLDDVCLIKGGEPDPSYTEDAGTAVMKQTDIAVTIELGRGNANETVWTSDLSHDYVTINAEYRT
jgi:glutamate N-acetyltransferase/amino-acid N-acetyltransferase